MSVETVNPVVLVAELADVLKGIARSHRVSQARLSELAGIPVPTLNRKLNGRTRIFVHDIVAIAEALGSDLPGVVLVAEERAKARAGR